MKRIVSATAVVVFFLTFGLSGAALHDGPHVGPDGEVFNVAKSGDVKIDTDVAIGEVLVKKGKYLFEHPVDGDAHILVLTGLARPRTATRRPCTRFVCGYYLRETR